LHKAHWPFPSITLLQEKMPIRYISKARVGNFRLISSRFSGRLSQQ